MNQLYLLFLKLQQEYINFFIKLNLKMKIFE